MNYEPSVRRVYEQCTDSEYRNNSLRGCRHETFLESVYRLNLEYEGLREAFDPVEDHDYDHEHYVYVVDDAEESPKLRAHTLLTRYLSAVYRVIEAIKVCLSTATGESPSEIDLHPETTSALSRWDDGDGGRQPKEQACDEVLTRFTYLRGVRNAVVHGTYACFDTERDGDTVVVALDPTGLDDDPALSGYDPDTEPATYSFTDTYLRFEDRTEAVYPVDNVFQYHRDVVFQFLKTFEDELR